MRIPFLWIGLGFGVGIMVRCRVPLPAAWIFAGLVPGLPFLWVMRGKRAFLPLMVFFMIFLGMAYYDLDTRRPAHAVEHWAVSEFEDGAGSKQQRVVLEGIVKSQPETKTKGRKVTVSFVLSARNLMLWKEGRPELHEAAGDIQVFLFNPAEMPEYGDLVRLKGMLERPKPAINPGQFDYGKYLAKKDIYAVFKGFGHYSLISVKKNEAASFLVRTLYGIRGAIARHIDRLYERETAPLFKALILGIRRELTSETRNDFMKTGTAHLLAISGMNITLVAGSFYFILIAFRRPQKVAAFLSLAVATAYVFIAGTGLPIQRAGWMAGCVFFSLLLEREYHFLNSFFLAFFLLLLFDPSSLTEISFQLSFLSVFSLVYFLPRFLEKSRWREAFGGCLSVMIGTFPVVIYYFNLFSPVSFLANLVVIPLFDLAVLTAFVSLLTGGVPWAGLFFAKVASATLQAGIAWIHYLAGWKGGYFYLPPPHPGQIALYFFILLFFLRLKFSKKTYAGWLKPALSVVWLLVASSFFLHHAGPAFSVTLFAAGKNEIGVLELAPRVSWVMNTGRLSPSSQADWILMPYLRFRGVQHLSGMLLTDFYARHTGGVDLVLQNFSLDYLMHPPAKVPELINLKELKRKRVTRTAWREGIRVRAPQGGEIRILGHVKNQAVFSASYGPWQFLFLPSLEAGVLDVLQPLRNFLAEIDVLVLPSYPQSKAGSHDDFFGRLFDLTDPDYVTLPFLDSDLKKFLAERDIPLLHLDHYGAVTFSIPPVSFPYNLFDAKPENRLHISSFLRGRIGTLHGMPAP